MKVKRKLKVGAEEFFDEIIDELYVEIRRAGNKQIRKSEIQQGFSFEHIFEQKGKKATIHCKVEELKRPSAYCLMIEHEDGVSEKLSHKIKSLGEEEIEDVYEHTVKNLPRKDKLNSWKMSSQLKEKMHKELLLFESTIIKKRKHKGTTYKRKPPKTE